MQQRDKFEEVVSKSDASLSTTRVFHRPVKSKLIGVHCTARMVDAIERYIEQDQGEMSRPEAIRQILRQFLLSKGLY